jgi:hypothetical protein
MFKTTKQNAQRTTKNTPTHTYNRNGTPYDNNTTTNNNITTQPGEPREKLKRWIKSDSLVRIVLAWLLGFSVVSLGVVYMRFLVPDWRCLLLCCCLLFVGVPSFFCVGFCCCLLWCPPSSALLLCCCL